MRPFICPYCAKSHTQADNLKIHIKKIHPELPLPSLEEMREMMSSAYSAPALYSALTISEGPLLTLLLPPSLPPLYVNPYW